MDPNNYQTIEEFVKSMEKVGDLVRTQNPDCIIVPMFGSIPFIDVLNILQEDFPNEKVEYVSASNKVHRLRAVLRGSFENIIRAYSTDSEKDTNFLSLDEVISGNSLTRVRKQFEAAKINFANKKTIETFGSDADFRKDNIKTFRDSIKDSIVYRTIGIEDTGKNVSKNKQYLKLIEQGIVLPIKTPCIVTMDRVDFFPAKYQKAQDEQGKVIYLPVVDHFNFSDKYMDFLKTVSEIVGKNPELADPRNLAKIKGSYKWVPENLRVQ